MNYKIEYSTKSEKSINQIYDYISKVLLNPKSASKTINGILKTVNKLSLFPKKHRLCEEPSLNKLGARITVYENYIIIYLVFDSDKTVSIVDIYYGKKNINK